MKKKYVVLLIIVAILCVAGTIATVISHHQYEANHQLEPMKRFESYDWSCEDNKMLAAVAANTAGSDIQKQQAIIEVLTHVWEEPSPIIPWVERHYELYNEPTAHDFYLVDLVVRGEWAE